MEGILKAAGLAADEVVDTEQLERCHAVLVDQISTAKRKVLDLVHNQHSQLAEEAASVSESQFKVAQLQAALHELQLSVEHPREGSLPRLRQSTVQFQATMTKLQVCERLVAMLDRMVEVDEALAAFEEQLADGELVAAAKAVVRMRASLAGVREASRSEAGSAQGQRASQAEALLRRQVRIKASRLRSRVAELAAHAVRCRPREVEIHSRLTGVFGHMHPQRRVPLHEVWEAARVAGVLQERLAGTARAVRGAVIAPLLADGGDALCVDASGDDALATITLRNAAGARDAGVAAVPAALRAVCEFLFAGAGKQLRGDCAAHFGRALWLGSSGLCAQALRRIRDQVPAEDAGDAAHEAAAKAAVAVEDAARELGLLRDVDGGAGGDEDGARGGAAPGGAAAADEPAFADGTPLPALGSSALSSFALEAEAHYASKRRAHVVAEARRLVLRPCTEGQRVGSGGEAADLALPLPAAGTEAEEGDAEALAPLRVPDCAVSRNCAAVLRLVHAAMEEACGAREGRALQLVRAARDCLDLFRVLTPVAHAGVLRGAGAVARAVALHHNDCMLLAHHCLVLGPRYRARLPSPLAVSLSFLDLVVPLREQAEELLYLELSRQRATLRGTLGACPHLSRLEDPADSETARSIDSHLGVAVQQLGHLHRAWRDVLPAELLRRALGALADEVAGHAVQQVLQIESSRADHQRRVARALTALEGLEGVLRSDVAEAPADLDLEEPRADDYIPYLPRLVTVRKLVEGAAGGIADAVRAGELGAFTGAEQQHLVRALCRSMEDRESAMAALAQAHAEREADQQ